MYERYKAFMNSTFREAQRQNLLAALTPLFPTEHADILDIGTGNGEFAVMIQQALPHLSIKGVDVIERDHPTVPITLYDGKHLPFEDGTFDYALLINMLHHTGNAEGVLKEALRVSRKGVIIKDHYADNWLDRATLTAMEYMNPNAASLLKMPLYFYTTPEWDELFRTLGLVCDAHNGNFVSYSPFWDIFFGRKMHFVGKYHRK